ALARRCERAPRRVPRLQGRLGALEGRVAGFARGTLPPLRRPRTPRPRARARARGDDGATRLSGSRPFERYVAIGDSSTEGLLDVDDAGELRGWSFRLAERIARVQGRLRYANLAARGATTREIVTHQLARAVAMRPDLATVFSGTNDVLRRRFDVREFAADVLRIHE